MSGPSWHTDDYPELRSGPPWVMQEMIAAEPELAERMLTSPSSEVPEIAAEIAATVTAGRPLTVTGCGTSEHAAHAVAVMIASALAPRDRPLVRALPALSAAREATDGFCLSISHDGGTRATALAVAAAREAGARTALITHSPSSDLAAVVDRVLLTPAHDESWCHTIAYVSALLAGGEIAARLAAHGAQRSEGDAGVRGEAGVAGEAGVDGGAGAEGAAAQAARELLADSTALDMAPIARRLADSRVVLCAGAGADHVTARELALKIAEGARMPAAGLELETVLHGQLAGHEPPDALVLVVVDASAQKERLARRASHVAAAAGAIGLPVAALLSDGYDAALAAELTPAGRAVIELPERSGLSGSLAALLAGAAALQALTLQLAQARGTNPDLIRREEEAYRRAAQAGEGPRNW